MLGLLKKTDARWAAVARDNLQSLLSDHAHCELKAAQSALSLLARFGGDWDTLCSPLTALANEEIQHFEGVQRQLGERGWALGKPSSDEYVHRLKKAINIMGGGEPLVDRLLVSAMVEARSAERFAVLYRALSDSPLGVFYFELLKSEVRHYRLFYRLAEQYRGTGLSTLPGQSGTQKAPDNVRARQYVKDRWAKLAMIEADLFDACGTAPTIHG